MLRGIYNSASGMTANQHKMNTISNNLANVDKTSFKRDTVVFKSFPELLIHRTNDDGVGWMPLGSFDISPIVGKLGTGAEVNEIYTRMEQGAVKVTERDTNLALEGNGFFAVQTNRGMRLTRNGSFILDKNGYLVDHNGFPLLGENGPIQVNRNNFIVKENGEVWINDEIGNDPEDFVGRDKNNWREPILLDRLQILDVDYPRHLLKEGDSFYQTTVESGEPYSIIDRQDSPKVLQGFLEMSNVQVVSEMVNMIEVQRSYEMNQKSIMTHDSMLGTLINQVGRTR